ncbi:MAG: PQQ-binding-like beta-propeller repeat protein [Planctomycetes bacterium]|nr:PQQ-binding-like beta-propeller repeat protein [Planctomycetota bacterium]
MRNFTRIIYLVFFIILSSMLLSCSINDSMQVSSHNVDQKHVNNPLLANDSDVSVAQQDVENKIYSDDDLIPIPSGFVKATSQLFSFSPLKIFAQTYSRRTAPKTTIAGLSPMTFAWFAGITAATVVLVFRQQTEQRPSPVLASDVAQNNTAPTASFTLLVTSETSTTISIQANASASSDVQDNVASLQVRWDWNSDGVWDTNYSTTKTATVQFNKPMVQVRTVTLQVLDTGGLTSSTTLNLSTPTPDFTISALTPITQSNLVYLLLDASISADAQDSSSALQVAWDFEGDGTWDTAYSTSKTAINGYANPMSTTNNIILQVRDSVGLTASITRTVNSPNPVFNYTVGSVVPGGLSITLDASASTDTEDTTANLRVRWDYTNDGFYDTLYSYNKTVVTDYVTTGVNYVAKLEVTDTLGFWTSVTSTLVFAPPTAAFTVTPTSGIINTTVFTADASASTDPQDSLSALRVRWDWENDGVYDTALSTNKVATRTYTTGGYKTIKLEVTDTNGLTDTETTQIFVNETPTASFTVNPTSGGKMTVYSVDASASTDPQDGTGSGSLLQVRWDWENDGTWDSPIAGYVITKTATHQYSTLGTKTIRLEIIDTSGITATTTRTVDITGGVLETSSCPVFRCDAQRTGQSLYTASPYTPTIRWSYATGVPLVSSTTIGKDWVLYFGSGNNLVAVKATDGSSVFTFTASANVRSSPAIDVDGVIYFVDQNDRLYAVNTSGTEIWSRALSGAPRTGTVFDSSPVIGPDGTIYVGASASERLYAITPDGNVKWYLPTNGIVDSSPTIGIDGTVYVGCDDHRLYAVTPTDVSGVITATWTYDTIDYVRSSAAIGDDGTIYFGSGDTKLYAINPNGTLRWTYTVGGAIISSPAFSIDGYVYIGGADGILRALTASTGLQIWDSTQYGNLGNIVSSSIVGADGSVYITTDNGSLYAFLNDGTLRWTWNAILGNSIRTSPVIDSDGTIYIGANNGRLYALEYPSIGGLMASPSPMFHKDIWHTGREQYPGPLNNTKRWEFTLGDISESSPALDMDGNIYLGCRDGKLYVLDSIGAFKWSYQTGGAINSSPAIGRDGTIYVGSDDNYLYALNPGGTLKWKYITGSLIYSSPSIARDGTIYVGSNDGKLYAINADGTFRWAYTTPNGQPVRSSPAISADMSTVYFGCDDGRLYAVNTSNGSLKWFFNTGSTGVRASPTLGMNGFIYFGDDAGVFHCVRDDGAGSPNQLWSFTTGVNDNLFGLSITSSELIYSTAAIDEGPGVTTPTIYFGCYNGRIYGLYLNAYPAFGINAGDGRWGYVTGDFVHSSPVVDIDGMVYVGSEDSRLYGFNSNGSLRFTFQTSGNIRSSPVVAENGSVITVSEDNKVYAIGLIIGGLANTPSPRFHYNQAQTGLNSYGGPSTNTPAANTFTGDQIWSSPAIGSNGVIYFGCNNGNLYAMASNGTIRWTYPTAEGDDIQSSPAIGADGTIYFGDMGGYVYALVDNGGSPTLLWTYQVPTTEAIYSSPNIDSQSNIYFGCIDGNLYSLNARGTFRWRFQTGGEIWSSPALTATGATTSIIYIGSNDGVLYAINSNGSESWSYQTAPAGAIRSSPAIGTNNRVYFCSVNGNLYCLDAVTGNPILGWPVGVGAIEYSSPALDSANNVYVGTAAGLLYSVAANGGIRWGYNTQSGGIQSSPIISNASGLLYFGTYSGGANGARIWCLRTSGVGGPFAPWNGAEAALQWAYPHYVPIGVPFGLMGFTVGDLNATYGIESSVHSSPALGQYASGGKVIVGSFNGRLFRVGIDPADITVTKESNKQRVSIGDVVTYKVTVKNSGIDPSLQTLIYDRIPYGFKYIKGSTLLYRTNWWWEAE